MSHFICSGVNLFKFNIGFGASFIGSSSSKNIGCLDVALLTGFDRDFKNDSAMFYYFILFCFGSITFFSIFVGFQCLRSSYFVDVLLIGIFFIIFFFSSSTLCNGASSY
jgi:hypothetical protein